MVYEDSYDPSQIPLMPEALWPKRTAKKSRRCPHCEQCFSKTEHLARHIRSHTKERPFRCDECGRTYSRQDSLQRHSRIHSHQSKSSTDMASVSQTQIATPEASQTGRSCSDSAVQDDGNTSAFSVITHTDSQRNGNGNGQLPFPSSILNTPVDIDFTSNIALNVYDKESWMIGSDFDFDSLNFFTTDWRPGNLSLSNAPSEWNDTGLPEAAATIQDNWFTTLPSDTVLQTPADRNEIDDVYREGLSNRLQPPPSNGTLPSADFLNLCIKLYFSKFNHVFPLLHAGTFRPSSEKSLLLLSVCSIGALFVGTSSATAQGRKIFLMLNKAILASWDSYIRRNSPEVLSLAQAGTIGQTFGMLSGYSSDLCLTEAFHGTVIAWARQGGFFKAKEPLPVTFDNHSETSNADEMWRSWAHREESMRLMLGLYIHDSEFSTTFHHEPLLRHTADALPVCSVDKCLHAPTWTDWKAAMQMETPHSPSSYMHEYAVLAGIIASIQESKDSRSRNENQVKAMHGALVAWHTEYSRHSLQSTPALNSSLLVLWHSAFIHLYADLDVLERAVGRDGKLSADQERFQVRQWASMSDAKRCVLHAVIILKTMDKWSVGEEPAIHVPKAIFYAAIAVYSYLKSKPFEAALLDNNPFPEFRVSALLAETDKESLEVKPSTLCGAINLLRHIGHWGISGKLSSILETLLDDLTLGR